MARANRMVRLLFLVLALICASLAVRRLYIDHLFDSASATINAHVVPGSVSNAFTHAGSSSIKYSFTLPDGRTFTSTQGNYSGNPGDTIAVEYVRTSPDLNRVAGSESSGRRLVWIFAIPATFFLLVALRLKL
jgi:hypothetical protein